MVKEVATEVINFALSEAVEIYEATTSEEEEEDYLEQS